MATHRSEPPRGSFIKDAARSSRNISKSLRSPKSQEGAQVTVPVGYAKEQYRLVGKLSGEPPFTGTLIHKGWKTEFVKLPRIVETQGLPPIAPAEVELK